MIEQPLSLPSRPHDVNIYFAAITACLLELRVSPGRKGFFYLRSAIAVLLADPGAADFRHRIYAVVGKTFGVTSNAAERLMIHSIESACLKVDIEVLKRYFGITISEEKGKPTCKQFLLAVAENIRHRAVEGVQTSL